MGSHVHKKDRCIQINITVLFGDHCLFVRIHAADTRAVTVISLVDIP